MTPTWSRRRTLAAGVTLIAVTNAVALGGVVWNRSGEPDSVLTLSDRDLAKLTHRGFDRERGGMTLSPRVRVLTADPSMWSAPYHYGAPEWLDEPKLASLGFDVSRPVRSGRYERQLPREALIVLELDGPAYKKALDVAEDRARKAAAGRESVTPGQKSTGAGQNAAENLEREQRTSSRLFAIDAGHDAAALRAKYPDRTRYAIVHGKVRMRYRGDRGGGAHWEGHLEGIRDLQMSVPKQFRHAVDPIPEAHEWTSFSMGPGITVSVAFGKRLEPWIVATSSAFKK